DLGLLLQAPERLRVEDAVPVPLERGAIGAGLLGDLPDLPVGETGRGRGGGGHVEAESWIGNTHGPGRVSSRFPLPTVPIVIVSCVTSRGIAGASTRVPSARFPSFFTSSVAVR